MVTKQDMQTVIENAKSRIIERMATRQDIQAISDTARDRIMNYTYEILQVHHQQTSDRANARQAETLRLLSNLENRLIALESEVKVMRRLAQRTAASVETTQRTVTPAQPEPGGSRAYTSYAYRSA